MPPFAQSVAEGLAGVPCRFEVDERCLTNEAADDLRFCDDQTNVTAGETYVLQR